MSRRRRAASISRWILITLLVSLVALPATGAPKGRSVGDRALSHLSQSVSTRYWLANPDRAPAHLQGRFRAAHDAIAARSLVSPAGPVGDRFNDDVVGFLQNEESISVCQTDKKLVMGSTNDYRGLYDAEGNFTGWHFSTDGGASLTKEGLLPPVSIGGTATRPSGGDPVDQFDRDGDCNIYASSLNYDPVDPFANTNGIGIYKTNEATLLSPACGDGGPSDPDCWPTRRYAAFSSDPTHFFDKEWFDVGDTGDGEHVWVTWSDFDFAALNPAGFTAEILAARCDADLVDCTDPIPISEDDVDVQFSDVTIGPDDRTYVTWSQILGEIEGTPQTFIHKLRIAPAGSTTFGPEMVIFEEDSAIPFGGFMHANDWRVATYPKNAVRVVGGTPRIYVVWDACRFRLLDVVCEESEIKLTYSDDDGATWSAVKILSAGGDNYFPTIANDAAGSYLAVAWYTNRFDTTFHNRQDVELVTVNPSNGKVLKRQRLTDVSNESEADPLLGGFFIGDYIEVAAHKGTAYVHYNANYRKIKVLGEGFPIAQQDNFLTKVPL